MPASPGRISQLWYFHVAARPPTDRMGEALRANSRHVTDGAGAPLATEGLGATKPIAHILLSK